MNSKANKNQGVRIIADFEDRAIPLNTPAGVGWSGKASRAANEGIRLLADFENDVRPLSGSDTCTLDALHTLFAQHEEKVHKVVNQLQETIEELKKQNADLRASLVESDRVINRYYLDGPNEDEI